MRSLKHPVKLCDLVIRCSGPNDTRSSKDSSICFTLYIYFYLHLLKQELGARVGIYLGFSLICTLQWLLFLLLHQNKIISLPHSSFKTAAPHVSKTYSNDMHVIWVNVNINTSEKWVRPVLCHWPSSKETSGTAQTLVLENHCTPWSGYLI